MAADPNYSNFEWITENSDAINEMIEAWTMERTKFEVFHILGKAGVPCGPTLNAEDIYGDPHLAARDMIVTLDHPLRGEFMVPGCPVKLSDSEAELRVAPALGQDTDEVLRELLDFSDEEIGELRAKRLIK